MGRPDWWFRPRLPSEAVRGRGDVAKTLNELGGQLRQYASLFAEVVADPKLVQDMDATSFPAQGLHQEPPREPSRHLLPPSTKPTPHEYLSFPLRLDRNHGRDWKGHATQVERSRSRSYRPCHQAERMRVTPGYLTQVSRSHRNMGMKVHARVESGVEALAKGRACDACRRRPRSRVGSDGRGRAQSERGCPGGHKAGNYRHMPVPCTSRNTSPLFTGAAEPWVSSSASGRAGRVMWQATSPRCGENLARTWRSAANLGQTRCTTSTCSTVGTGTRWRTGSARSYVPIGVLWGEGQGHDVIRRTDQVRAPRNPAAACRNPTKKTTVVVDGEGHHTNRRHNPMGIKPSMGIVSGNGDDDGSAMGSIGT